MKKLEREVLEVAEQHAIFNGAPRPYVSAGALIELLNYGSLGGGKIRDRDALIASGEAKNAKLYNVRIIVEVEEIVADNTSSGVRVDATDQGEKA